MSTSDRPPHPDTLRELAQLQLAITAVEQVIRDKQDPAFVRALGGPDPADREESAHAA